MMIQLLYFGRPREKAGLASETANLPGGIVTIAGLLAWLRQSGPVWETEFTESRVRCAVNQELGALSSPLRDGDEVAIFSPISGG